MAHCSASSETSVVVEKLMNISEFVAAVKPKAASNDQRPSVAAPGFAIVIIRLEGGFAHPGGQTFWLGGVCPRRWRCVKGGREMC